MSGKKINFKQLESRKSINAIRAALMDWYELNARPLPWRIHPTPYKTILSEFMLQQTQVKTVLPYFQRWLELFPSIKVLARAPEKTVLNAWAGLGYYNRARNLLRLAKVLTTYSTLPGDYATWLTFPGIGPYTAAAITSIAFGAVVAVVDGNVIRVLARLFAEAKPFSSNTAAAEYFKPLAQALINPQCPGAHNEAMMELGATLCCKHKPLCEQCPLKAFCCAFKEGNAATYPVLKRAPTQMINVQRALCVQNNNLLLVRIPEGAKRLAGFYEIPYVSQVPCGEKTLLGTRTRCISQQRIREDLYHVYSPIPSNTLEPNLHWVAIDQLSTVPIPGPHRKWLAQLIPLVT